MNENFAAELNSVHDAKVLLCWLLDRLGKPVTEKQLYEIVLDSGVVNYFYYTEAAAELVKSGSAERFEENGESFIRVTDKGRGGAAYFNEHIPLYFRKQALKAALYYFARLKRENDADIEITDTEKGCEVRCVIKDTDYDLMRMALYAPDREQAELIKEKIMLDPAEFYRAVLGFALENEEEKIDVNAE